MLIRKLGGSKIHAHCVPWMARKEGQSQMSGILQPKILFLVLCTCSEPTPTGTNWWTQWIIVSSKPLSQWFGKVALAGNGT